MPRKPSTLKTARDIHQACYVAEASALIFAAMRAACPEMTDWKRDKAAGVAVDDAAALYRVLEGKGFTP